MIYIYIYVRRFICFLLFMNVKIKNILCGKIIFIKQKNYIYNVVFIKNKIELYL